MRTTYAVVTEALELTHLAFDGFVERGGTQGTHVVVIGNALQDHFATIQAETEVLAELDAADAERYAQTIDDDTVAVEQHFGLV